MSAVDRAAAAVAAVGDDLPPRTFGPITRTDIVRYQGASGDLNPLHHDEIYARSAGFPSVFSVGMLQAGLLGTFLTDFFGASAIRRLTVRFREQVWPGDEVTCRGSITNVTAEPGGGNRLSLDIACARAGGGDALVGSAEVVVAGPASGEKADQ